MSSFRDSKHYCLILIWNLVAIAKLLTIRQNTKKKKKKCSLACNYFKVVMDDSFTYILELCEVAIIVHNLTFGQKS